MEQSRLVRSITSLTKFTRLFFETKLLELMSYQCDR